MTLKYFISGSLVTIFLLVAILLYFMDFFTFNYVSVSYLYFNNNSLTNTSELIAISTIQKIYYSIIIAAFLFKLGAFPFHFYLVDMYQTLNTKETMFMYTVALKISIFFTLLKFLSSFWFLNIMISDLLICSGFGSIFVSSFGILKQYKLSKFWAYSYLNSIGYVLVSLSSGVGGNFGEISFYSAKVYFFTYMLVWLGILDIISRVSFKIKNKVFKKLYYVSDLSFLSNSSMVKKPTFFENVDYFKNNTSLYFSILIISLLGLPPTLGFFSKSIVYFDLISNIQTVPTYIVILALTPFVSYAYLKIIIYVLFTKVNNKLSKLNNNLIAVYLEESSIYVLSYENISKFLIISPICFFIFENINCFGLESLKYLFIK